jgi:hypothetical protein
MSKHSTADTVRDFTQGLARSAKQSDLGFPLAMFLATRVLLSLLGLALWVAGLIPTTPAPWLRPYFGYPPTTQGVAGMLLGVWERFDAIHYLRIARFGYGETPLTAFSPLYPLLVRTVAWLSHAHWTLAAVLVSNTALAAALVLLYRLVLQDFGDRSLARRTVVYTVFFPTAVFLVAPYPESLLLLFSVGSLFLASHDRWKLAIVPLIGAGLVRPQGVALSLPMLFLALGAWRARRLILPWFASLCPFIGWGLYLAWRNLIGFPPISEVAARYWQRIPAVPLSGLWQTAIRFGKGQVAPVDALDATIVILMLGLGIYLIRRLPPAYSLYHWGSLVLSLSTITAAQPLASQARYAVTLFPAMVALAFLGARGWTHRVILYISFAIYIFVAGQYMMWGWVG